MIAVFYVFEVGKYVIRMREGCINIEYILGFFWFDIFDSILGG